MDDENGRAEICSIVVHRDDGMIRRRAAMRDNEAIIDNAKEFYVKMTTGVVRLILRGSGSVDGAIVA